MGVWCLSPCAAARSSSSCGAVPRSRASAGSTACCPTRSCKPSTVTSSPPSPADRATTRPPSSLHPELLVRREDGALDGRELLTSTPGARIDAYHVSHPLSHT